MKCSVKVVINVDNTFSFFNDFQEYIFYPYLLC